MNLRSLINPALSVFFMVVGISLFTLYVTPQTKVAEGDTLSPTVTIVAGGVPTAPKTTGAVIKATAKVTPQPTKKVAPTSAPVATCIITVNGSRYNVQKLKSTHSGGNIFKCGTDMTATFKGMHGTDFQIIAKYRI